jgi:gamma-glutamylputrescine oxidase
MKQKKGRRRRILLYSILSLFICVIIYSSLNFYYFTSPLVIDENKSIWANHIIPPNNPLENDIEVDIAVIGGGYTGLSAAWHLAQQNPDKRIILLEAKTLGSGASGRHGGMVLPILMPHIPIDTSEIADLKLLYDTSVKNIEKISYIEKHSGINCDLVTNGFLFPVFKKSDIEPMKEFVRIFKGYGFPLEFLNQEQLKEKLGTKRYEAGIYVKDGGTVHAMKLVHALKVLNEEAAVEIYEQSPVTEIIEAEKIKLKVGEDAYTVQADHIVLATNAFASKLGYFKGCVMPLHIITAASEPLNDDQLSSIGWKSRLPFADSRIELYHLVLTPDNRIVIGGGYSNYFYNNDLNFKDDLNEAAEIAKKELFEIFPELDGIEFDYVWNGVIGVTADAEEIYGVTGKHKNILYALGYNGHGVNTSILCGELIAGLYAQKQTEYMRINDGTSGFLPPEPFRFIGVQSYLKYARWYDEQK